MTIHSPPQSYMLRNIVDVATPSSVSWYPQTLGWKILAFVFIVFVMFWTVKRVKIYWHNRYRREALVSLRLIDKSLANNADNSAACMQISYDMHRVMKSVLCIVNSDARSFHGDQFLVSLDAQMHLTNMKFADKWAHWPQSLLVQPALSSVDLHEVDLHELMQDCQFWLKNHHSDGANLSAEVNGV
ncbi:hypothetical protein A9264_14190 [Vibrio sp. UCD-FRSSP16_10]|uniref:DUF4381 domain-containing protein n=1 Tax=unclassified Vibrio TaxID=2614977 RepID=UPI0008001BB2|nr:MULTISPECIES: DUF4381 domain-containing protein [unclassified Vibrio]OBT13258.1 hypothetical protein A9260_14570 [Vibrio sp. UCD-FRSSP16_30]OBT19608.1 hypothetical protein A9264_14190 [Vibrio sp. UCD-FRSSP16_10]